jgi:tetratricopeptide (TPR) repeat protein
MSEQTQHGALRAQDERLSIGTRLRQVDLTLERRREKQALYGWLDAFAHRSSQLLIIEGDAGSGKSQFIKKACRRSHNRNVLLVTNDARKTSGPFGLFRSWIEDIRQSDLPASVAQELSAFVNTRRLLSLLCGQTNDLPTQASWRLPSAMRGTERKDQLTAELVRFFRIFSRHRPLVLAVSNFDRLDDETRALVKRVFCSLANSPVGFIITTNPGSTTTQDLAARLDHTRLSIPPLNLMQIQGLIRQICKRHQLSDRFIGQLGDQTQGNPTNILLTLWYLIDARYVVYAETGWSAPAAIPWASLPTDLHRQLATRMVETSSDAGALLKGLAIAEHHVAAPRLLDMLGWNRERFNTVRDQINLIFPVFSPLAVEMEAMVSMSLLRSIREYCITSTERAGWCHRIAGYLADSGQPAIHEEIAEVYDAGGRGDASLTYRIAAGHRAKSVACYNRAAYNLEEGLKHCDPESALYARLLIRLGDVQSLRGMIDEARSCAESATRIAKAVGSLRLEADAKFFLAGLETSEGALTEGLVKLDQSLALYKAAGRGDGQLSVLSRMATVYRELRMWPQSDAINDEMLALAELESNPLRLATSQVNAAISSAIQGERQRAAEHLYRALRICRKNGYWDLITHALIDFADAIKAGADNRDLDRYYVSAVASARRRFDEVRELEALYKLSASYLAVNAHRKARAAADQVILQAEMSGETRYRGEAIRIAGICASKHDNSDEASKLFTQALEISESTGDEGLKARTLADKGDWAATKHPDLAESVWREARNIFCRLRENTEVLRMDRNLIKHTYEHARAPERYSQAV